MRAGMGTDSHDGAAGGAGGRGAPCAVSEEEVLEIAHTKSYLFRYDYGAFWMARPMAFSSPLTRLTLPNLCLFMASSPYMRCVTGFLFSTARLFRMLRLAPRDVISDRSDPTPFTYTPYIHPLLTLPPPTCKGGRERGVGENAMHVPSSTRIA